MSRVLPSGEKARAVTELRFVASEAGSSAITGPAKAQHYGQREDPEHQVLIFWLLSATHGIVLQPPRCFRRAEPPSRAASPAQATTILIPLRGSPRGRIWKPWLRAARRLRRT